MFDRKIATTLSFLVLIITIMFIPPVQAQGDSQVQKITGTLEYPISVHYYDLSDFQAEDTLYIHAQSIEAELELVVTLYSDDYETVLVSEYADLVAGGTVSFSGIIPPENVSGLGLSVTNTGPVAGGDYEITIGINEPLVLDQTAIETTTRLCATSRQLRLPLKVAVGQVSPHLQAEPGQARSKEKAQQSIQVKRVERGQIPSRGLRNGWSIW